MGKLLVGTLTGQHVVLERLRSDHLDEIVAAGSGDRSTFGLTQVPANHDEAAGYISYLLDDAENDRAAPFVQRHIVDGGIDNSVLVGCTRFMNPHWWLGRTDPDEVEIGGTWLNSSAQRTPLNTEAKILMLTHAFDKWHVQRVAICTDAENSRSRRAIERIGASFEGVLRRHRRSLQTDHVEILRDSAMYSITIDDWPAVRGHLESLASG
jgi:RimJ/RimL family protein N-acetyltransferase